MNLIISGMRLMMKGLRVVMNGSLVLNSTRLARFCTAFATSLRVREAASEGLAGVGRTGMRDRRGGGGGGGGARDKGGLTL